MNQHLKTVFTKMGSIVGVKFEDIKFEQSTWYHEFEWTFEQEQEFKEWLNNYLIYDTKARNMLCKFPNLVTYKKHRTKFIEDFVSNYGWKLKQEKEGEK
jgi:hypothetical protein